MTQPAPPRPHYACATMHHLHFSEGTPLPPVCLKCGRGGCATVERSVEHAPSWLTAVALIMLPVAYVLYFVIRKRRSVHVPLCPDCTRNLDRRRLVFPVALLLAIACLVLPLAVYGYLLLGPPRAFGPFTAYLPMAVFMPIYLAIPLFFAPLISRTSGFRMGEPPKMYAVWHGWPPVEVVSLVGVHPSALAALQPRP